MKENLPQRKKIRLKYYDYSMEGYYFITICTKNRLEILSKIRITDEKNISELTKEGKIVDEYLNKIEDVYSNIFIDEYIIMPNHIHMILIIKKKANNSISKIVQQYKTAIIKKLKYSIWQKSFYEHVIRSEEEYYRIKEYIKNNVINWEKDKYF